MNATIQSMRAIPELQSALDADAPSGLPSSLKTLYSNMKSTIDAVTPAPFLNALRTAFPQFAEMARGGGAIKSFGGAMYAQQGECTFEQTVQEEGLTRGRCGGVLDADYACAQGRTRPT